MKIVDKVDRPLLISIIGYLHVLGALFFLAWAALFVMGVGTGELVLMGEAVDINEYVSLVAGLLVLIAVVFVVIGKAFLSGWSIAWYLTLILQALNVLAGILAFPAGIFNIVISGVLIYYLFRPSVKGFFNI